jgi:hypothetical protein
MVDIKTAVRNAIQFVRDVYEGVDLKELALEEVRLSDDGNWWLVTVGFRSLGGYTVRGERVGFLQFEQKPDLVRLPRDLKLVKIDAQTGQAAPQLADRELSRAG